MGNIMWFLATAIAVWFIYTTFFMSFTRYVRRLQKLGDFPHMHFFFEDVEEFKDMRIDSTRESSNDVRLMFKSDYSNMCTFYLSRNKREITANDLKELIQYIEEKYKARGIEI